MSAKRQSNRMEAVRDAATGYTVVVLALVCFLIALVALMAGVRFISGLSQTQAPTAAETTPAAVDTTPVAAETTATTAEVNTDSANEGEAE